MHSSAMPTRGSAKFCKCVREQAHTGRFRVPRRSAVCVEFESKHFTFFKQNKTRSKASRFQHASSIASFSFLQCVGCGGYQEWTSEDIVEVLVLIDVYDADASIRMQANTAPLRGVDAVKSSINKLICSSLKFELMETFSGINLNQLVYNLHTEQRRTGLRIPAAFSTHDTLRKVIIKQK